MKHRFALLAMLSTLALHAADAQGARATYARADTLRGSYTTPQRIWWDVTFYDLHVAVLARRTARYAGTTASPTACSCRPRKCRST